LLSEEPFFAASTLARKAAIRSTNVPVDGCDS